jgi:inorganic pyrophosphatase
VSDYSAGFWAALDELVSSTKLVIDRPRGKAHPRYPSKIYPLDYGYLEGTSTLDGGGIDVWVGEGGPGQVQGVQCTVDLFKRDTEIKILMGCSTEELAIIDKFLNQQSMRAIMVMR